MIIGTRLRLFPATPGKVNIDNDVKGPLYRYFSTKDAAENSSQTWVPGVNQNRYFHEDPDSNEYFNYKQSVQNGVLCHETSTIIGQEALSFTTNSPEKWKALYPNKDHYWIRIDDIDGYIKTLLDDCLNNQHIITWLDKDELLKKAICSNNTDQIAVVHTISDAPPFDHILTRGFQGLFISKIIYDGTALGKGERFKDQCEIRVAFSWDPSFESDRANIHHSLFHLVEYYKFNTPNVCKYYTSKGNI